MIWMVISKGGLCLFICDLAASTYNIKMDVKQVANIFLE